MGFIFGFTHGAKCKPARSQKAQLHITNSKDLPLSRPVPSFPTHCVAQRLVLLQSACSCFLFMTPNALSPHFSITLFIFSGENYIFHLDLKRKKAEQLKLDN
jgi:hypothetical protein